MASMSDGMSDGCNKKDSLCETIRQFIQESDHDAIPIIDIVEGGETTGPSNPVRDSMNRINDDELDDLVEEQLVLDKIKEVQNARLNIGLNRITAIKPDNYDDISSQSQSVCDTNNDNDSLLDFVTANAVRNDEIKLREDAENISKALTLNIVMQSELSKLEFHLLNKLKENQRVQMLVKDEITMKTLYANKADSEKPKCLYSKFGMPYFKDDRKFSAYGNSDFKKMCVYGQILSINHDYSKMWRLSEKVSLEEGIKTCLVEKESTLFLMQEEKLKEQLKDCSRRKEKEIKCQLASISSKLDEIKQKSLPELFSKCSPGDEFDWMRISVSFVDSHSPQECQRMWHLYVKPSVNKKKWTAKEDNDLSELAKKYNNEDWDLIAEELNTNRTGYQCFVNYQTRLNKDLRKLGRWTREEDKVLCTLIDKCRVGSYIPWPKIAYYFKGRSLAQIYCRWTGSLNPELKKGRFSRQEDRLIVSFVRKYGEDFCKISKLVGDRTSAQLRERYSRTVPGKYHNTGRWSLEEDKLLLALVKKYGVSNWSAVSKQFITRTRTQIRQRYKAVSNILAEHPHLDINDLYRGPSAKSKHVITAVKMQDVKQKGNKMLSELIEEDKMKEDLLRNENKLLLRRISLGRRRIVKRSEIDMKLINYFKASYTNDKLKFKTNYLKPDVEKAAQAMLLFCQFMRTHIPVSNTETDLGKSLPPALRKVFQKMVELKNSNWGCGCLSTSSQDESYTPSFSVNSNIDCLPVNQIDTIVSVDQFLLSSLPEFSKIIENNEQNTKCLKNKFTHFIPYYLPPSMVTTIGFRSVLLIKDKIAASIAYGRKRCGFFPNDEMEIESNGLKKFTGYFTKEIDNVDEKEDTDNSKATNRNPALTTFKYSEPTTSITLGKIPSTSGLELPSVSAPVLNNSDSKSTHHVCNKNTDGDSTYFNNGCNNVECLSEPHAMTERLSEQEAINLWKERLMAVLGWPIVLSNHHPDFSDNVASNAENELNCCSSDIIQISDYSMLTEDEIQKRDMDKVLRKRKSVISHLVKKKTRIVEKSKKEKTVENPLEHCIVEYSIENGFENQSETASACGHGSASSQKNKSETDCGIIPGKSYDLSPNKDGTTESLTSENASESNFGSSMAVRRVFRSYRNKKK